MQVVIELTSYLAAARQAGIDDAERAAIVDVIAADPTIGKPIAGGARKVRIAGRGKGKSGGYRIITYFGGDDIPVFLITCFAKGEKDNLTHKEKAALAALTNTLRESLTAGRRDISTPKGTGR